MAYPIEDWTTPHINTWTSWLNEYRDRPFTAMLEIGVCAGRSSVWFCEHILTGANCRFDGIDSWQRYPDAETIFDEITRTITCPKIRKLKGSVETVLPKLYATSTYDIIYADGPKHAEILIMTLALSWQMLRSGGVLIVDDLEYSNRRLRLPPRIAIDGWLPTVMDNAQGYEIHKGQVAVWKKHINGSY